MYEESSLISVPRHFSPQELVGHFLWKKTQDLKSDAVTRQLAIPTSAHC